MQPAIHHMGCDGIAGEVVGMIGIGLGDHVQVTLQNHARRLLVAGTGRLADAQVAESVAIMRQAEAVGPGLKVRDQSRFMAGRTRGVAQSAEMAPQRARRELLEMCVHGASVS